jgi:2-methylcitrate dehydratase PrpD
MLLARWEERLHNHREMKGAEMKKNGSKHRGPGANLPVIDRRTLLQRATWIFAVSGLPFSTTLFAEDISPVMAQLSAYMSEAHKRALPDKVMDEAKHHILDTIAAMVSGSELLPGRQAMQFARSYGGEKIATIVASQLLGGPIEAAMVNAELAHSDETDDYYSSGGAHPGCSIVPATLAAGELWGIDGLHFLRAVTLGYDLAIRVLRTVGDGTFVRDTHNLIGTFGSTAAAGCAARLNAQQMRWLLDYAAQQAGAGMGSWRRDTEHIEKGFVFAGMAARNGVSSALMVQSGWTGVNDILSGADNFVQTYSPKADPAGLTDKLGERYEVAMTTIKRWTVGAPIQSPLDAIELMRKRHPFEANQVQQVVVRLDKAGANTVNNRDMPNICLQHLVAVMLIDKTVSFRVTHDAERMKDPAVLALRAKVQMIPDPELDRLLPARVAIVEVTLADGTKLSERVDAVRGTPENPMLREEIVAKSRDLITPVLGAIQCNSLIEKILTLENLKNIRELRPLLQRA